MICASSRRWPAVCSCSGTGRWWRRAPRPNCSRIQRVATRVRCSPPRSIWKRRRRGSSRNDAKTRTRMSANAILVAVDGPHASEWVRLFREQPGRRRVYALADDTGDPADIGYACVWRPPAGLLSALPNLRMIVQLGAGADHLLAAPRLPDVPIVRAAHPDLSMRVTEYVVLHTLRYHRRHSLSAAT